MKKTIPEELKKYRKEGNEFIEPVGIFEIKNHIGKYFVVSSNQYGWDHVSVHKLTNGKKSKVPNWNEMCYIKNLFFNENETVVQFHPKKSEYVNVNENVLHLWKNQTTGHELPPIILV